MRVWYNGRTSAFQADDAGSIPATRSSRMAGSKEVQGLAGPSSSGVEHFLGKEEVTGSIPVLGSTLRVVKEFKFNPG